MNKALTEVLTPEYLGIICVTKDHLNKTPKLFNEIDYLFDGLITRSFDQTNPVKRALYVGKSFGHPFFLAHFEDNNSNCEKDMDETINIVSKLKVNSKKILVISDRKFSFKKFKEFHLQSY